MTLATDFQASVKTFLGDLGRSMTLRHVTPGTYDPTTGATTDDVTTDYTGTGRLGNYRDSAVDGTLFLQGDRQATFVPDDASATPVVGDTLIVGSDTYSVINGKERSVNGTAVSWTLQVRL
jgi:hypothetical protein